MSLVPLKEIEMAAVLRSTTVERTGPMWGAEVFLLVMTGLGMLMTAVEVPPFVPVIFAVAGQEEATMIPTIIVLQPTDSQILAWALAGAVGAGCLSIAMWPPETRRGSMLTFLSNCLFGLLFGPATMQYLSATDYLNLTMANTLAISATLSFFGFSVIRPAAPIVSEKLVKMIVSLSPVVIARWVLKIAENPETNGAATKDKGEK